MIASRAAEGIRDEPEAPFPVLAASRADAEGVITPSAHFLEVFFALPLVRYLSDPGKGKGLTTVS